MIIQRLIKRLPKCPTPKGWRLPLRRTPEATPKTEDHPGFNLNLKLAASLNSIGRLLGKMCISKWYSKFMTMEVLWESVWCVSVRTISILLADFSGNSSRTKISPDLIHSRRPGGLQGQIETLKPLRNLWCLTNKKGNARNKGRSISIFLSIILSKFKLCSLLFFLQKYNNCPTFDLDLCWICALLVSDL